MRTELNYFRIGTNFGGNQDWMTDPFMRMGGCGALAVCDSCIVLAKDFGAESLVPFDVSDLTKKNYIAFGQSMKQYLPPRMSGINKLSTFVEEAQQYLADRADATGIQPVSGIHTVNHTVPWQEAGAELKAQLDKGIPVPTLLLHHKDRAFKEYIYHWFSVTGYEEQDDGTLLVKCTTYGASDWFSLERMWDTGHPQEDGGFVFWELAK